MLRHFIVNYLEIDLENLRESARYLSKFFFQDFINKLPHYLKNN
jgi:hypothetical protein